MTSQCNLNGCWLGFQQSAAVPRVRQVRYRVSMGNCYGLLPLQRIQNLPIRTTWGICREEARSPAAGVHCGHAASEAPWSNPLVSPPRERVQGLGA